MIPDPILPFETAEAWKLWLRRNHSTSSGVWIRLFRRSTGRKTVTHLQALDEALCYGWIDAQAKGYDDTSWLQRFTPRAPRSLWSKRNRDHVARLVRQKRMRRAGTKAVEAAKADGRWDRAYDSPATMKVPSDFLKELKKNPKAWSFFKTLNKANTYAIAWRLQTAKKAETRARRMATLLAMMARGRKLH